MKDFSKVSSAHGLYRREFLELSLGWLVAGAAQAASRTELSYTEQVSSVLMSADNKKLVVMTPKFHYIFDAPPQLVQTLKADFHSHVQASMGVFTVSSKGHTRGQINLKVVDAPPEAIESAIRSGYKRSESGAEFTTTLEGERYRAGEVAAPAQYKLNKTYPIEVTSAQAESATRWTPIQIILFVPIIAGVALFGLGLLLNCALTGTLHNCHE